MRYLSLIIVLTSFVSACQTSQTSSVEAGIQAQIHRQALLYAPAYTNLDREKVMVACIDWASSNLPQLSIRYVHMTYTGIGSDVPVGIDALFQGSHYACEGAKTKRGLQCECTDLLHNDVVVLRVPEGLERLPDHIRPPRVSPTRSEGRRDMSDRNLCLSLPYKPPDVVKEAERRELTEKKCKEILKQ